MNKQSIYWIIICLSVIILSLGYFAYNQQWIIFHIPKKSLEDSARVPGNQITKKRVTRNYWNNDAWNTEETELLWSDNKADTLMHLITSWLALLEEEKVMDKKVTLQSVVVSSSGVDAYISFDRNPFLKNQSTYSKLLWVEGLLKTVRENEVKVQNIHFLVHHQLLTDFHLDFSNPWPVTGFVGV